MKKIISILILTFSLGFISSCDTKSCDEVICGNNQSCNGGQCFCNTGYEGANCDELAAEKFVGNYSVSQSCSQGSGTFVVAGSVFYSGSPINELQFQNFLGLGVTAYAYVSSDQSGNGTYLRFPSQNLGASTVVGEGYYQDFSGLGRITIDIQLTHNNQLSVCNYTYY